MTAILPAPPTVDLYVLRSNSRGRIDVVEAATGQLASGNWPTVEDATDALHEHTH